MSSDLVVLNLRCLWGARSCVRLWLSGGGSSLEIETCRWAFGVAVVSGITPRVFCSSWTQGAHDRGGQLREVERKPGERGHSEVTGGFGLGMVGWVWSVLRAPRTSSWGRELCPSRLQTTLWPDLKLDCPQVPRLAPEEWELESRRGPCPPLQVIPPRCSPLGRWTRLGAQQEGRGRRRGTADGSRPHPLEAGVHTAVGQSLL